MQTYLVGGAVRDRLLGLAIYDQDWVVVGATPEQLLSKGFTQVGKDFPVFLHPDTKQEYALARTERKQGQGYHGFVMEANPTVTLEQDLLRRDLTINAMAQAEDGQIIDPYGGRKDLESKVLRHVSPAFSEDPLRVLRVARFAAKLAPFGFTLASETQTLLLEMSASGELDHLTPERVWQETLKALNTPQPSVYFKVLDQVGALTRLFPEVAQLKGVRQPIKYHPEGDAYIHSLMVLDAATQLSDDLDVRFAALVHDLGKGLTPPELWPKHHGHEQAGVPLVKHVCHRYRVPKKTQQFAEKATEFHGLIHKGLDQPRLKPKTYLKVLKACGAMKQPDRFKRILQVCQADARGRTGFEQCDYPQFDFWLALLEAVLRVDNQAIMAQGHQGKAIAEAIEKEQLNLIQSFLRQTGQSFK